MVILNFVPVSSGGGLQNALSFIKQMPNGEIVRRDYIIFCRRGSEIEYLCNELGLRHFSVKNFLFWRFFYELFYGCFLIKKHKGDIVFSIFGGAPLVSWGFYKISGFAYSNIIQSEVNFWWFLPMHKRIIKKIIDRVRLFAARQSDHIIVETQYLADRAKKGIFYDKSVSVIKMAPSFLVLNSLLGDDVYGLKKSNCIDILYMAGAHKNKRIDLLPEIIYRANLINDLKFRLVTTLDEKSGYYKNIKEKIEELGLEKFYLNLGVVSPSVVGSLLKQVDGVVNISLLESFSNNWVEAWASCKPLIATDADWCRSSCGGGAIYINPLNSRDSADILSSYFADSGKIDFIVKSGKKILETLPSTNERHRMYENLIIDKMKSSGGGYAI